MVQKPLYKFSTDMYLGLIGLLCGGLLYSFAYDSPAQHPKISAEELALLSPHVEQPLRSSSDLTSKSFTHVLLYVFYFSELDFEII